MDAEHAHLMVNQGIAAMRDFYVNAQAQAIKWQQRAENEKREREQIEQKPPADSLAYWEKRVAALNALKFQLETENRKLREFMRLKDRAKMRVERTRDMSLRTILQLENRIVDMHNKAVTSTVITADNERQAAAFAELEGKYVRLLAQHRKACDELSNTRRALADILNPQSTWKLGDDKRG